MIRSKLFVAESMYSVLLLVCCILRLLWRIALCQKFLVVNVYDLYLQFFLLSVALSSAFFFHYRSGDVIPCCLMSLSIKSAIGMVLACRVQTPPCILVEHYHRFVFFSSLLNGRCSEM